MTNAADPWAAIAPEELRARQNAQRNASRESGLDGLVVDSRGGGLKHLGPNVLYRDNHYPNQLQVTDCAEFGSAPSLGVVARSVIDSTVRVFG